jgi:hypothetical protein
MTENFHPDDELTAEERAERIAEQELNWAWADAGDAKGRIQRHAVYGDFVETPDAADFAALERVGLTAEQVISWLPACPDNTDGRAR